MKNYYEVLGVEFDASKEEIKKAYRDKMKQYHPDIHDNLDSDYYEQKTKDINEAYDVLSNEEKRRRYDEERRRKKTSYGRRQYSRKTTNRDDNEYNEYETNRKSRHQAKDNSFFDSIKKSYKEVKEDESEYPFKERHKNLNKKFCKKYGRNIDSAGNRIAFRMGQGAVHISAEFLYQLSKLSYVNKDNVIKYVLRNRRLAALIIAGIIFTSNIPGGQDTPIIDVDQTSVAGEVITGQDDDYNSTITLVRNYTVQAGDSLSSLSDISLIKVRTIKGENRLTSNMLYIGDVIKLPYEVSKDDLQYYTKVVNTNGKSIADLANIYETDVDTLYKLNKEAIETVDGAYIITSETVLVPEFITSNELSLKKEGKVKAY